MKMGSCSGKMALIGFSSQKTSFGGHTQDIQPSVTRLHAEGSWPARLGGAFKHKFLAVIFIACYFSPELLRMPQSTSLWDVPDTAEAQSVTAHHQ